MEAYALSTHIDINAGLPWLEVCMPSDHHAEETVLLQERFDIDDIFSSPAPAMRNRAQMQNSLSNGGSTLSANTEETHHSTFHEHADEKQNHNYIYPLNLRHHEPLAFSKTGLLRPILDKFTFQSHQIFHRPPIHYSTEELISFINQGLVYQQDEVAVDHIELQIDLLHFKLDSYQFKTTIDLIRNVLLEPPKPYRRHLQREKFDHVESETTPKPSKRVSSVAATEMEETLKSKKFSNDYKHLGKKGREALRSSAMGLLRDLEDRLALSGDNINRRIAYTLSKLKWSIQCPDEIDDVEIAFTGFYGQHDYSTNGSVVSHFGLEDVRISSSKPGPDSICFLDPTSVVKSVLGDERSPCQRCGEKFDHNENNLNSCKFHQGTFKSGTWSCCKSTKSNSLGCKAGPHTGKERAATVRVEALPRSVDGITLYTHFEVNIFPSVPHTLVLQISKSMSRLFMNYFFVEDDGKDDLDTLSTVSEVKGSVETNSTQSESTPKQPFRKSLLIGGKGSLPAGGRHTREDLYQNRTSEFETPSELEVPDNLTEGAEIIFIKVWRVGYVNINISTGGFRRLPQTSLDICVPAYSKAYEVGTSAYLGHKFLTYLIKEVLKSGASSGLDKFRKKMMGGNYSSPNIDQGKSYVEERESPPTSIIRTDLSELGPNNDRDTYLRRHLHRPIGADAILGTPAKKVKQKKGLPFGKK